VTHELDSVLEHLIFAEYRPSELPEHAGNPLIEALPPFRTADEMMPYVGRYPQFAKKDSSLPKTQRMMAVSRLNGYLEPMTSHYEVIEQMVELSPAVTKFSAVENASNAALVDQHTQVVLSRNFCDGEDKIVDRCSAADDFRVLRFENRMRFSTTATNRKPFAKGSSVRSNRSGLRV
jgi:hypothetical protein